MTTVRVTEELITVEGHAGYAPAGQDIVCAAISMLTQTLEKSLKDLTRDHIEYIADDGRIEIRFKDLSEQGKLLVDSFFVGVCLLTDAYGDYVQII